MRYSDNYSLKLPQRGVDRANVDDLDYNFEKIDNVIWDNRRISVDMHDTSETYDTAETSKTSGNPYLAGHEDANGHIHVYKCLVDNTTGTWAGANWEQTDLASEIEEVWANAGTDVEANPSGTATETLEKLRVDSTIYAIPEDVVSKEAEGNPIEITDGADAPLVKCETAITGSQNLHGYDKPWVGGAGKNKLPLVLDDIKSANTSGTWSGNAYTLNGMTCTVLTDESGNVTEILVKGTATSQMLFNICNVEFSGSYILNGTPQTGSDSTYALYTTVSGTYGFDYGSGVIVTFDGTSSPVRIVIRNGYAAPLDGLTFYPMIRLSTVTDPTFEPYSNICPITAYTEGEIEVRGKNIGKLSAETEGSGQRATTTYSDSGVTVSNPSQTYARQGYVFNVPNGVYTLSYYAKGEGYRRVYYGYADAVWSTGNPDFADTFEVSTERTLYTKTLTVTKGVIFFGLYINTTPLDTSSYITVDSFQLEKGQTATPYEPYTSTTHTTTYPSAIFRGSEDVVKGEVSYDKLKVVFTGDVDENWITEVSSVGRNFYINISDALPIQYLGTGLLSNMFEASPRGSMSVDKILISAAKNLNVPVGELLGIDTVEDWKTWLSTHNLEVVYSTEQATSSVTPTNLPVKSLNGYSHIESTTGDMDIEYITSKYSPLAKSNFKGATASANGESGLVPAPSAGDNSKYLRADGTWQPVSGGGGSSSFAGLTDVNFTDLADEDFAQYDATSQTWKNVAISGVSVEPVIYSTDERKIGVWADGKPLYQKTLLWSGTLTLTSSAWTTIPFTNVPSNMEYCQITELVTDCIFDNRVRMLIDSGVIKGASSQASQTVTSIVANIQYTKSTDTAGSGTWTPSGVPAVHYSTDEKVVGTWIDGSTIYEKTWEFASPLTVSQSSWTATTINKTGIAKIINAIGHHSSSTFWGSICATAAESGDYVKLLTFRNNDSISVKYLTLQYTKTAVTRSETPSETKGGESEVKEEVKESSEPILEPLEEKVEDSPKEEEKPETEDEKEPVEEPEIEEEEDEVKK